MSRYNIKVRLMMISKNQRDILAEVRKRGFIKLQYPTFNAYVNGAVTTPQSDTVLALCDQILTEWEQREIS